jgi:hypothetical protein
VLLHTGSSHFAYQGFRQPLLSMSACCTTNSRGCIQIQPSRYVIVVPTLCCSLVGLVALLFPPADLADRVALLLTLILTIVALKFTVNERLPVLPCVSFFLPDLLHVLPCVYVRMCATCAMCACCVHTRVPLSRDGVYMTTCWLFERKLLRMKRELRTAHAADFQRVPLPALHVSALCEMWCCGLVAVRRLDTSHHVCWWQREG